MHPLQRKYRDSINAFVRRFPKGTSSVEISLRLDAEKPGLKIKEYVPPPMWVFKMWWDESVKALENLK